MLLGTISKIEELGTLANQVKKILLEHGISILFLEGEIGAGKTTFCKYFIKTFKVKEEVTSPTFVYLKEYSGILDKKAVKICHYDLYRINELATLEEKLQVLNQVSFLENVNNSFVLVEWPERINDLISNKTIILPKIAKLEIKVKNNDSRIFDLKI